MIYLTGTGMGNLTGATVCALDAIKRSELLIGSRRLALEAGKIYPEKKIYSANPDPESMMEIIRKKCDINSTDISILYSGDTLFYSGASRMAEYLGERDIPFVILPGISTCQYMAARLGRSYEGWNLLSSHGRSIDIGGELMKKSPLFLLTSGKKDCEVILDELSDTGIEGISVTIAEDLSYASEKIIKGEPAGIKKALSGSDVENDGSGHGLIALLIDAPVPLTASGAIEDDAFVRGESPMSKQYVRSMILSLLRIDADDICLDIGAGTGAVTIDMAMHAKKVYSVECIDERTELIKKNIRKFKAYNVSVIKGDAADILEDPSAASVENVTKIFIGGSDGRLSKIFKQINESFPNAVTVFSAVLYETLSEGTRALDELGMDYEIMQLSISRAKGSDHGHMLKAENPVYLVRAGRFQGNIPGVS
ncbi:MAG: precorrin-6y C5,15-methyltransferase (decarboxylating) subunit CbiE [Lachnospiraceae bacterium]|nr:precorrin-6y C5,15-methyltransferase (decarboxylating) subunit CbiE [Lachnospiraceae bacterium]